VDKEKDKEIVENLDALYERYSRARKELIILNSLLRERWELCERKEVPCMYIVEDFVEKMDVLIFYFVEKNKKQSSSEGVIDKTIIASNLKSIMLSKGQTQTDFAKACGITQAALSQILNMKRYPSLETVQNISSRLKVTVDSLLKEKQRRLIWDEKLEQESGIQKI